jgi:hypothetical protein
MTYIIGLILLWFRSEYAFVFFFGLALAVLDFLFLVFAGGLALFTDPGMMTLELVGQALLDFALSRSPVLAIFIALGCAIVAFRKWQKGRKSSGDKTLDAEMDRIRAEIGAREGRGE